MALAICNTQLLFPLKKYCAHYPRGTFTAQFINLCLNPHVFDVKNFLKYWASQVSEDMDDDILKVACMIILLTQLQKN